MPPQFAFFRAVLAIFCVFFAFALGRVFIQVRGGRQRWSRLAAWIFRVLLCALALLWRAGLDTLAIVTFVLAALALAAGAYLESRPREEEDLTREIFPPSEN